MPANLTPLPRAAWLPVFAVCGPLHSLLHQAPIARLQPQLLKPALYQPCITHIRLLLCALPDAYPHTCAFAWTLLFATPDTADPLPFHVATYPSA